MLAYDIVYSPEGETPLSVAARSGKADTLQYLFMEYDVSTKSLKSEVICIHKYSLYIKEVLQYPLCYWVAIRQ